MKFIGIGDNVVDRYVNRKVMFPGGNAVNFAVFAKKCGFESAYLGILADDREGRLIRGSLCSLGIDVSQSPLRQGLRTERCDVALVEGDRVFIGSGYGGGDHENLTLLPAYLEYLQQFGVIHCGCYADMEEDIRLLADCGAIKTFDFSEEEEYREKAYLEKVCPYIDMALFSGAGMTEEEIAALQETAIGLGTRYVMITLGVAGQILYDGRRAYEGKAERVVPVDTMGAGDSFFAGFVSELVRSGWDKAVPLREDQIDRAFSFAAKFSASICLIEGAFGFATNYEEE